MNKPNGMTQEVFERYIADGFDEEAINQIWINTLITRNQMKLKNMKSALQREQEVTCQNYERSQKRQANAVKHNMGWNR